jgi:hypothetical protein
MFEVDKSGYRGVKRRAYLEQALKTRGCSCLVLNESAGTTSGEQRRRDERFSHRSGRRLTSGLCEQLFKKYTPDPSFTRQRKQHHGDRKKEVMILFNNVQPFVELGNPPSFTRITY